MGCFMRAGARIKHPMDSPTIHLFYMKIGYNRGQSKTSISNNRSQSLTA